MAEGPRTPRRRQDDVEIEDVKKLLEKHTTDLQEHNAHVSERLEHVEITQSEFSQTLEFARVDQTKILQSQAVLEDRSSRTLAVLERLDPVVTKNATRLDSVEEVNRDQWSAIHNVRDGGGVIGKFLAKFSGRHLMLIILAVIALVGFIAWLGGAVDLWGVRVDAGTPVHD